MEKLAQLLKTRLKNEKMSVRDAAKEIGVSHSTVARAVNGEKVEVETLVKIADFLGTTIEFLVKTDKGPVKKLEKIGMVLNMEPELYDTIAEITQKILNQGMDKKILSELAAFASYRLHIHEQKQSTKRSKKKR